MAQNSFRGRRQTDGPIRLVHLRRPKLEWKSISKMDRGIPSNAFIVNENNWCIAKFRINVAQESLPIKVFIGPFISGRELLSIKIGSDDVIQILDGDAEILIVPTFETTWKQINGQFNPANDRAIPANPGSEPNVFIAKAISNNDVGIGTIYRSHDDKWMVRYQLPNDHFDECDLGQINKHSLTSFEVLAYK